MAHSLHGIKNAGLEKDQARRKMSFNQKRFTRRNPGKGKWAW